MIDGHPRARHRRLIGIVAAILALWIAADIPLVHAHPEQRGQHPRDDRSRVERRERGFRALPREEQERVRDAEHRYRSMTPEQREELRQRWRNMSEKERDRYRRRIERNGD